MDNTNSNPNNSNNMNINPNNNSDSLNSDTYSNPNQSGDYHGAYADIINLERPVHIDDEFAAKHPPIPRADRAKIFASFAALKDNLTSHD